MNEQKIQDAVENALTTRKWGLVFCYVALPFLWVWTALCGTPWTFRKGLAAFDRGFMSVLSSRNEAMRDVFTVRECEEIRWRLELALALPALPPSFADGFGSGGIFGDDYDEHTVDEDPDAGMTPPVGFERVSIDGVWLYLDDEGRTPEEVAAGAPGFSSLRPIPPRRDDEEHT